MSVHFKALRTSGPKLPGGRWLIACEPMCRTYDVPEAFLEVLTTVRKHVSCSECLGVYDDGPERGRG